MYRYLLDIGGGKSSMNFKSLSRDWVLLHKLETPEEFCRSGSIVMVGGDVQHLRFGQVKSKGPGWEDVERKTLFATNDLDIGDRVCYSVHFEVELEDTTDVLVKARNILFAYDTDTRDTQQTE